MIRWTRAICVALLNCASLAAAQCCLSKVDPNGKTVISGNHNGTTFQITIRTTLLKAGEEAAQFPQCTLSRIPCSLTQQISLLLNKKEVFIPKSAYADLGDILSVSYTLAKNTLVLFIDGGDASESYRAKLTFRKQALIERRLYSGEDLGSPLQVSRYYKNSLGN